MELLHSHPCPNWSTSKTCRKLECWTRVAVRAAVQGQELGCGTQSLHSASAALSLCGPWNRGCKKLLFASLPRQRVGLGIHVVAEPKPRIGDLLPLCCVGLSIFSGACLCIVKVTGHAHGPSQGAGAARAGEGHRARVSRLFSDEQRVAVGCRN